MLIPASALLSGQPLPAVPAIRIVAANGTLTLGGTLLESETEATVRTGGGTTPTSVPRLRLDLADDTWLDGLGGTFVVHGAGAAANASVEAGPAAAAAYALIRGLQSQQVEANGWNAVIQAALRPWHLVRVSNTSLEVLLPDERAHYDIASPETVRVTAPEAALTSARQVQGLPSFVIRPTRGVGRLSNSLVGNNSEADVQEGPSPDPNADPDPNPDPNPNPKPNPKPKPKPKPNPARRAGRRDGGDGHAGGRQLGAEHRPEGLGRRGLAHPAGAARLHLGAGRAERLEHHRHSGADVHGRLVRERLLGHRANPNP